MKAVVKFLVFVLALNLVESLTGNQGLPIVYKEVGVPSSINFETVIYTIDPVKLGNALSNALEGALNHQEGLFKPDGTTYPPATEESATEESATEESATEESAPTTEEPSGTVDTVPPTSGTAERKKRDDQLKPYKIQGYIEIIELE
uniref:Uncharacterized protein n=1 Tax=Panagrolaimus sp. JU765 TaxID=591449 RepID=A0AC34REZ8_9BILA